MLRRSGERHGNGHGKERPSQGEGDYIAIIFFALGGKTGLFNKSCRGDESV